MPPRCNKYLTVQLQSQQLTATPLQGTLLRRLSAHITGAQAAQRFLRRGPAQRVGSNTLLNQRQHGLPGCRAGGI